jgi:putative oxidoreductase
MLDRDRRNDLALLVLRLTGLYFAFGHGLGKVMALSGGDRRFVDRVAELGFPVPELFAWAAALVELAGGLLITFGLATRVAAGLGVVVMAVAAFLRHRALQQLAITLGLSHELPEVVASWGSPEMALLFLATFLALVLLGPGRWSLDHLVRRRRERG